jgi:hypothetical protein
MEQAMLSMACFDGRGGRVFVNLFGQLKSKVSPCLSTVQYQHIRLPLTFM